MKIRTKLILFSVVFVALVVAITSTMLLTFREVKEEVNSGQYASELMKHIFELNMVTYEYLMHHEKRMAHQWDLKYNSLGKRLSDRISEKDKKGYQKELSILKSINLDYRAFGDLFSRLKANFVNRQTLIKGKEPNQDIDLTFALEERLAAQILIRGQKIVAEAYQISGLTEKKIARAEKQSNMIALFCIIGFVALLSYVSFRGIRTITRSLGELTNGAEIIGKGDLEYRVDIKTKDEIGILASAFNEMVLKLAEANKDLESFAYSVSHDLRAPLRAIDGFSKIVAEDYGDKLDEDGQRQLGVIQNSARDMGKLIDDLLAFSRMGRKSLKKSKINMHTLADDVTDSLQLAEKKQRITLNIKELPSALGDRAMLREVLVNLLSNAMKFSRPKDKPAIEISGSIKGSESIYYVKDNGVGFDMKYKEKLFQVFQRLHSADEFEGTGIGLALVQRIVHRHGGRVWAESKVNKGATFYFSLPRAKSDQ